MRKFLTFSAVALSGTAALAAPDMQSMGDMKMPDSNASKPSTKNEAKSMNHAPMNHGTMNHEMMSHSMMGTTTSPTDPMAREGSGTAWLPDSSPMYMAMKMRGRDRLMLHGTFYPRYTRIGGDRDVSAAGRGGRNRFDAPSMVMGMYTHPLDKSEMPKSQLGLRLMLSADPLFERGYGYPLLFQSGESYKGESLHDRQHPHDLFSELSATYSRRVGAKNSAYLYLGYPGEPALGPPTFMHRVSGMDFPDAPLAHHWEDSTHITFGVATLGYSFGRFKAEASAFNGREPDENRINFDSPRLSSYAGRLSWNPTSNLAFQVSNGLVKSPEELRPDENQRRTTASALYNKPLGTDANLATALIFGQNDTTGEGKSRAYTFETALQKQKNTVYVRAEHVGKSGEELELNPPDTSNIYAINALSVGYVRDLKHGNGLDVGLGAQLTFSGAPGSLNSYYGSGTHTGGQIFLRIRPSKMKMDEMGMGNMKMKNGTMGDGSMGTMKMP